MAHKFINTETIIGRIYQHDLVIKKVQNENSANYGKDFIGGKLDIAVDEDGLNKDSAKDVKEFLMILRKYIDLI